MLSEKKMKFLQIEMHYGEKISSGFELHCKKKEEEERISSFFILKLHHYS